MPDKISLQAAETVHKKPSIGDATLISRLNAKTAATTTHETLFQTLLNQSSQLIWLLDATGNVLEANQTALAFGKVDWSQVADRPIYESWQFLPGEQVRLKAAIATASHGRTISYDTAIQQDINRSMALHVILRTVEQEPGQPVLLMMEGTDVSDRKQVEAHLLRCQRLQSLSYTTVEIAHDINNFLTPILGCAHLLPIEFPEADEKQRELFKMIDTNVNRASKLLKQMTSFARGQPEKYAPLESDRLVNEVQALVASFCPPSISIETYLPSGLWAINGDETQLHQVLMNLCINAMEATPNGGFLKLSAENIQVDRADSIERGDVSPSRYVAIQVSRQA